MREYAGVAHNVLYVESSSGVAMPIAEVIIIYSDGGFRISAEAPKIEQYRKVDDFRFHGDATALRGLIIGLIDIADSLEAKGKPQLELGLSA